MIRVSEHVRKTHSQDGGIVLDVKHGRMFGLNLVGSKIIELLGQEYSPTFIAQEIARTFGVSVQIAERDVREFIEALEKHQLVEVRSVNAAL
jgi:coenzyme PQQ synthesis protein D (PqqD)